LISATGYTLTDYYTQPLNLYQENGEFLGLPLLIFPSFIFYNEDLFDAAGLAYPPHEYGQPYTDTTYGGDWTISKTAEIARLLTLDSNGNSAISSTFDVDNIVQFGYLTQWTSARGEATLFGADSFVDAGSNAQIPSNWRTAFHWYYDAMWGSQPFIPNDSYDFGGSPFNSNHVAMAHCYLWCTCCLPSVPNWDIAATPSYSGTITSKMHTDGLRILRSTEYPIEAFQALTYIVGDGAPTLVDDITMGFPARISLQSAALADLEATYPDVDWQVMVDSIDYTDDPSHEGCYMPNYQMAENRITEFYNLYHGTPGLDIDAELDALRDDLQVIFHPTYLPLVMRNYQ
jgi:multiple sugar transport system substrate-binding protein